MSTAGRVRPGRPSGCSLHECRDGRRSSPCLCAWGRPDKRRPAVSETVEPSTPAVGVPLTLPSPSARNPAGNISAPEAERQFCRTFRAEEAQEGACCGLRAAWLPYLILTLHQNSKQFLIDVAPAVPALIDDQRVFVTVLSQLLLETGGERDRSSPECAYSLRGRLRASHKA